MPRNFQPLLLESLDIRLPGVQLQRLALHRHLPATEQVVDHQHGMGQCLLYLRGRGIQRVGEDRIPVRRGSLLYLPPRRPHGFEKEDQQRPVCLVLDWMVRDDLDWPSLVQLGSEELGRVERGLHRLAMLQSNESPSSLRVAGVILEVAGILHDSLSRKTDPNPGGLMSQRVREWIEKRSLDELKPSLVARELGLGIDPLNRRLQRESGTTVGRLLAEARLAHACAQLQRTRRSVGDIGAEIGYPDQSYFARWFRQQTGQSPGEWRRSG